VAKTIKQSPVSVEDQLQFLTERYSQAVDRYCCIRVIRPGHHRNIHKNCDTYGRKCKQNTVVCNKPSPLWKLTCHMGLHSVTCHSAEVTFKPLHQSIKSGTRCSDPGGMQPTSPWSTDHSVMFASVPPSNTWLPGPMRVSSPDTPVQTFLQGSTM